MIRKKEFKNVIYIFLVLALTLALTACSSTKSGNNTSTEPSSSTEPSASSTDSASASGSTKEPVTLTIWDDVAPEGEQTDAVAQELKKKFNVTLNVVRADATKQNILITSGDVPDIVLVNSANKEPLMNSKLLLPLDDLLAQSGKDISANLGKSIDYSKKFMSPDGKLYVLMTHAAPSMDALVNAAAPFEHIYGGLVRWDYYKELGYPTLKSQDDFLDLLAQMVQKHPKTADGKKVYGMAMNIDWDLWPWVLPSTLVNGATGISASNSMIAGNDGVAIDQFADENAPFFSKSAKFYNKAYRMGLLDPESFTQKSDAVKAKVINGQVLSWTQGWFNTEINAALQKDNPDASMLLIPGAFPTTLKGYGTAVGYTGQGYGIGATSKHPDRAMEILNYFASYEGNRLAVSGVKGVHWDIIDGKAKMMPSFFQDKKADPDYIKKNGFGLNTMYSHLMSFDPSVTDPEDGMPIDLTMTDSAMAELMNPAQKDYSEHYQGNYPGAAFEKAAGKDAIYYANSIASGSLPAIPEEIKRINDAIKNSILKSLPKIIMSKTDADYSTNVKAEIAALKSLGIDKANDWFKAEFEKAKVATKDFQ